MTLLAILIFMITLGNVFSGLLNYFDKCTTLYDYILPTVISVLLYLLMILWSDIVKLIFSYNYLLEISIK